MTNKIADVLRHAKEVIDTPDKWTKDHYAVDANGRDVSIEDAVCFCLGGAIGRAGHDMGAGPRDFWIMRLSLTSAIGGSIASFNDNESTTFEDVHKALDDAITLSEERISLVEIIRGR